MLNDLPLMLNKVESGSVCVCVRGRRCIRSVLSNVYVLSPSPSSVPKKTEGKKKSKKVDK